MHVCGMVLCVCVCVCVCMCVCVCARLTAKCTVTVLVLYKLLIEKLFCLEKLLFFSSALMARSQAGATDGHKELSSGRN